MSTGTRLPQLGATFWRVSTKTCVKSSVRTTTTTTRLHLVQGCQVHSVVTWLCLLALAGGFVVDGCSRRCRRRHGMCPPPEGATPIPRYSGLWSSTSTFQFLVVEDQVLVFKVFPLDRVQQRRRPPRNAFLSGLWSRSWTFLVQVEVFMVLSRDKVHLLLTLWCCRAR